MACTSDIKYSVHYVANRLHGAFLQAALWQLVQANVAFSSAVGNSLKLFPDGGSSL